MPTITMGTAAILTLILLVLSYRVSQVRLAKKVNLGDADDPVLIARIRAHGNFTEYVPMLLILILLIELAGGNRTGLMVVAATLVLARLLHAAGMARPAPNKPRVTGTVLTWLLLLALPVWTFVLML
ncbi:MAG: MAPEG family protein [Pseudomonadota bacterium]